MNKKDLIFLLLTVVIVAVIWVAGNLKQTHSQVQVSSKLSEVMASINPNFDQDTLNKVTTLATNSFTPAPVPSISPSPTSSSSAALLPVPPSTILPTPSPLESSSPSASPVL